MQHPCPFLMPSIPLCFPSSSVLPTPVSSRLLFLLPPCHHCVIIYEVLKNLLCNQGYQHVNHIQRNHSAVCLYSGDWRVVRMVALFDLLLVVAWWFYSDVAYVTAANRLHSQMPKFYRLLIIYYNSRYLSFYSAVWIILSCFILIKMADDQKD